MKTTRIGRRLALSLIAAGLAGALGQSIGDLDGVVLSNDAWPRATRLAEWTSDVMRISGVETAPEIAQGKVFFEWLRLFSRMAIGGMIQSYEGPYGNETSVLDAHKQLFVYGWGFCDTSSRIAEAAWQEYRGDAKAAERVCVQHDDGGYHTMYRLRLDGRYAAFDPRYGYYLIERDAPDARILDWAELHGRFELNRGYKHRSAPFFEVGGKEWNRALLIQPGYYASEDAWREAGARKEHVFGDGKHRLGAVLHDMTFALKRGMTITRYWNNSQRKFYVPAGKHTQRELPFLPSGRFYRVTEQSLDGNWAKHDPNYLRARPYLAIVPTGEGYPEEAAGSRSIGQAYGVIEYRPRFQDAAHLEGLTPGSTLVHSVTAPHLRPARQGSGGEAIFDFRSPFVLVDGTLTAVLAGEATEVAVRTLEAKRLNAAEPDTWSNWQTLFKGGGAQQAELGRPRFNGRHVSIHGVYQFQVRVKVHAGREGGTATGLSELGLRLYFENGIMSIPPLFAGKNVVRLRVKDSQRMTGPITVTYRYDTESGEQVHQHVSRKGDFIRGEAEFTSEAAGLRRCRSVTLAY